MKFYIVSNLNENIKILMRNAGYRFQGEGNKDLEMSFVRPLKGLPYPRFHAFVTVSEKTNEIIFNLHLDQKKPSYEGTSRHGGEYEGPVVETEVTRISRQISPKNR